MYKSFLEYQQQPRVQRSGSLKHPRYTKAVCLPSVCIFLGWLNQISWLAASKMRWNSPVPTLSQFQHLQLREIRSPKPAKEDLDPWVCRFSSPLHLCSWKPPWGRCGSRGCMAAAKAESRPSPAPPSQQPWMIHMHVSLGNPGRPPSPLSPL